MTSEQQQVVDTLRSIKDGKHGCSELRVVAEFVLDSLDCFDEWHDGSITPSRLAEQLCDSIINSAEAVKSQLK